MRMAVTSKLVKMMVVKDDGRQLGAESLEVEALLRAAMSVTGGHRQDQESKGDLKRGVQGAIRRRPKAQHSRFEV